MIELGCTTEPDSQLSVKPSASLRGTSSCGGPLRGPVGSFLDLGDDLREWNPAVGFHVGARFTDQLLKPFVSAQEICLLVESFVQRHDSRAWLATVREEHRAFRETLYELWKLASSVFKRHGFHRTLNCSSCRFAAREKTQSISKSTFY